MSTTGELRLDGSRYSKTGSLTLHVEYSFTHVRLAAESSCRCGLEVMLGLKASGCWHISWWKTEQQRKLRVGLELAGVRNDRVSGETLSRQTSTDGVSFVPLVRDQTQSVHGVLQQ